jgi:hypothetical protein
VGGWNYNCFPYAYTRYSVGGYGTTTTNYWKIDQYGGGDVDSCVESNQVWSVIATSHVIALTILFILKF